MRYHLGDATINEALEASMATSEHKYLSDFARKYYGEGEAKGKAEGKAEGKAKGPAVGVLSVLSARGLAISPEQRRSILECTDTTRLDRWISSAVAVESVDEIGRASCRERV